MLAQEGISCVSVHKATWEGGRKRSGSLKTLDLYLAAPLQWGAKILAVDCLVYAKRAF